MALELGADRALVAEKVKLQRRVLAQRARSAGDHHRRAAVAAHRVDGDSRARVHR